MSLIKFLKEYFQINNNNYFKMMNLTFLLQVLSVKLKSNLSY